MCDEPLYDLYFITRGDYQQLQVQLAAKFHEVGGFFFVLVAEAFIYCDESEAAGVLAFFGDTELVGDGGAEDGICELRFFSSGELTHLSIGFFEFVGVSVFFICPEFEPVAYVEYSASVAFAFFEVGDEWLYLLAEV